MKRFRFSLLHPLLPAIALLAGLILVLSMTSAQALPVSPESPSDVPGGIQGHLYEPLGTSPVPVEGGWIDIFDTTGQPWMGTSTAPDGFFQITNLPPGEYIVTAYPPPGSPFAAAEPMMVNVPSGAFAPSISLHLTHPRISGWVQDADTSQRIEGAPVLAHTADWSEEHWTESDFNGEFKIGAVQIGTPYIMEVFAPHDSEYQPLPLNATLLLSYTVVPTATGVVLELSIPPTNVVGSVVNYLGAPVPGAGIVVFHKHEDFWQETAANEFGDFMFRGLPTGTLWIQASPPWGPDGAGLLSSPPFSITLPQPESLVNVGVITLPKALKTVTGQVIDPVTPATIDNAVVVAHRLDGPGFADTPVNMMGAFTLSLPGGEWHLDVGPLGPPAPPPEWVFPGPPAWIHFQQPISVTEEITGIVLEVIPTDARVQGHVVCPGGMDCSGDPPHWDIWVELRNDEIHNGMELDPSYDFNIPIPAGWYELVVHVFHPDLQGPEPMPVFVGPNQILTLPDITLMEKNAHIVGRVRSELGIGVPGVAVFGWQPEGFGWGYAETNASGVYTMNVVPGGWFVEPHPDPEQPFVYRGRPRIVRVAPNGTVAGVDFNLTRAGARIEGTAVDAHTYDRLWGLNGWAWAEQIVAPDQVEFFSDAPMWDGGFNLKVQGGKQYNVGLHVPPHAPYVSGGAGPVPVGPGATVTLAVPLERKDAVIEGHLIDALTGSPPTEPVWAEIFGEDERGHWVGVGVDPHPGNNARYELAVVSGTWHLRARVDPASGYVAVPTTTLITIQSGQVINHDFEIWPINATISGQVIQPNGAPLSKTEVFAEGESPFVGHFEAKTQSDELGNFELHVPEGGYVVGAGMHPDRLEARGWLPPKPIDVPWVSVISPTTGLELRFRQYDGEIHGNISFAPGLTVTTTHPAYVWGWSEDGDWAETVAMTTSLNTFTYTLRVVSDTVWHIGAVYEDWDNDVYYESPEAKVPVLPPSGQAVKDLELGGPWPLPQPFIISFDGSQMQTIIMPDGIQLTIPAGALVTSGTVTLHIFPTRELRPEKGKEVIGAGYEIWATDQNGQEITQFNQDVVMTIPYPADAVLKAHGIVEQMLIPVYYSTLVGRWTLADSYVLDTVNNEITLQISHFTKFGAFSTSKEYGIYLPLVLRNT
jgi:hypothetical protein